MSKYFKRKKVLIAGGTGMIGTCLVNKLLQLDSEITVASLESKETA
ncbi:hypothetical protein HYW43_02580 [Candidatus Daviesbacteria bacterium]|nr:hypothetical protein [Candidatus Daviesbacteria bacterium]